MGANVGSAFESGNLQAALSRLPDVLSHRKEIVPREHCFISKVTFNPLEVAAPTLKLDQSVPLENRSDNLVEIFEKNGENSSNISIINIKETITYFKNKTHKSIKKYDTVKSIFESVDTVVFIVSTTTSATLSITGFGLLVVPISSGLACVSTKCSAVIQKLIVKDYNQYEKQFEKDQQTIKSFDK